jgi:hypothetical protein
MLTMLPEWPGLAWCLFANTTTSQSSHSLMTDVIHEG